MRFLDSTNPTQGWPDARARQVRKEGGNKDDPKIYFLINKDDTMLPFDKQKQHSASYRINKDDTLLLLDNLDGLTSPSAGRVTQTLPLSSSMYWGGLKGCRKREYINC